MCYSVAIESPIQPQSIIAQLLQELDAYYQTYTDVPGLAKVRDTAANFINFFYRTDTFATPIKFDRKNVIITAGAVQSVYNVLALSVENKNDVVISPLPAYGLYKHQTELLGKL